MAPDCCENVVEQSMTSARPNFGEPQAPRAQDMTSRRVQFKNFVDELQKAKNRVKARARAKVEHPFRIRKRIFGFEKVRYRGIKKNHHRLCAGFALVNLYLHRRRLAVARA